MLKNTHTHTHPHIHTHTLGNTETQKINAAVQNLFQVFCCMLEGGEGGGVEGREPTWAGRSGAVSLNLALLSSKDESLITPPLSVGAPTCLTASLGKRVLRPLWVLQQLTFNTEEIYVKKEVTLQPV